MKVVNNTTKLATRLVDTKQINILLEPRRLEEYNIVEIIYQMYGTLTW